MTTQLLYYEDAYLKEFEGKIIKILKLDGKTGVVLDRTAFYVTGGGQPSDTGFIKGGKGEAKVIEVQRRDNMVVHVLNEISGEIKEGDVVKGVIDWNRRYALMRNHTSAHLMAEALRQALQTPLKIVGSAVEVEKSRLDLTYDKPLRAFFPKIEEIANTVIKQNRPVEIKTMPRNEAERYVEKFNETLETLPPQIQEVRIVEIKQWHACACGGTHVKTTGEIGSIKILGRASKGRGIERIEFTAQKP
jgi:Ser-tRNA(Ala) deacylase AlaX